MTDQVPEARIRERLQALLRNSIDAASLNATVKDLSDFPDTALVSVLQALNAEVRMGQPANEVARPFVEMSMILAALQAPLPHHTLIRDVVKKAERCLADLPNDPEQGRPGWFAARVFFPARRACLARLARDAAAAQDGGPAVQNLCVFDTVGVFAPLAEAVGKAPLHPEALAMAGAARPVAARAAYWLAHPGQSAFSFGDGELVIHAGDVPLGVRRPLTENEVAALRTEAPNPVLWWWVECGWPPQQERRPSILAERVPGFVRYLLKAGQARLILSSGHEISFASGDFAARLAELPGLLECPPTRVAYVAQNPSVTENYAAQTGKPDATRPLVCTANTLLLLPLTETAANLHATRSHRFLCLNNIPHRHRSALLLRAHADGFLERGLFSFNWKLAGDLPPGSAPASPQSLKPYFPDWSDEAIADAIRRVDAQLPMKLDLDRGSVDAFGRGAQMVREFSADLTSDAYFYVVTESDMETPDKNSRFTEKLVKPLASCNPFILFGNAHVLKSLREMGFETFGDVIDERYDLIADPVERFNAAYEAFRHICLMTLDEHAALYERLKPRLEHNRANLARQHSATIGRIRAAFAAAEGAR